MWFDRQKTLTYIRIDGFKRWYILYRMLFSIKSYECLYVVETLFPFKPPFCEGIFQRREESARERNNLFADTLCSSFFINRLTGIWIVHSDFLIIAIDLFYLFYFSSIDFSMNCGTVTPKASAYLCFINIFISPFFYQQIAVKAIATKMPTIFIYWPAFSVILFGQLQV